MKPRTDWRELIVEVPRDPFIPDTIWIDIDASHPQSGFTTLSRQDHPQRWQELVTADEPVLVVHQLGPRRLWDEVKAAYDCGTNTENPTSLGSA